MLYSGAAFRDITPHHPVDLYGYPHVQRVSTGVHDPLLATALVLKNDCDTLVLASLDLLMIEPGFAIELRKAVADVVHSPEKHVFISCTHTHSGPVTSHLIGWEQGTTTIAPDPAYLAYVKHQLVLAVEHAVASMHRTAITWTQADATGVGGNRLHEDGITDRVCGLLVVQDLRSSLISALAVIYGMHPTVLHEDSTLISADFPFYTRSTIQTHLKRQIPIVYHNAPSGDQSPRRTVHAQTFDEAERLGSQLGMAICHALDMLDETQWGVDSLLAGCLKRTTLIRNEIKTMTQAEKALAIAHQQYRELRNRKAPRAEIRTAECAVFGAEGALTLARVQARGDLADRLTQYQTVDIQALRIGDVILIGLPGECFTAYALEIKQQSPLRAFVVSLVNGDLQGYIVTPEQAQLGGYEAAYALFAPESGQILVAVALACAEEMARYDDSN